eukprot:GHVS01087616.1.p1 GENE.GHVS01087616.1~~GHVS01087616.1.p1  ORF type:complete len:119 (-),score=12.87 GHVS01087616.1:81-437(-)
MLPVFFMWFSLVDFFKDKLARDRRNGFDRRAPLSVNVNIAPEYELRVNGSFQSRQQQHCVGNLRSTPPPSYEVSMACQRPSENIVHIPNETTSTTSDDDVGDNTSMSPDGDLGMSTVP